MVRKLPLEKSEDGVREWSCGLLSFAEIAIYVSLGFLLCCAALVGIGGALHLVWTAARDWTGTSAVFQLIDRLLFILMLVEILYTVRISIKSHLLVVEPFLIVGLIATIRRILVLTLQAEALTSNGRWNIDGKAIFHASMLELAVLGLVASIFVTAIYGMRRTRPSGANKELEGILPQND